MNCEELQPSKIVCGMLILKRDKFDKEISVPCLRVDEKQINHVLPLIKKSLLKMDKLRPVRDIEENNIISREILLHPLAVKSYQSLPIQELQKYDVNEQNFSYTQLKLTYDNWRADEIFKSVLADQEEALTSYSRIGHIVHLNLRDHLLPFKQLIGEVLRDKVPGCRTVVNKATTIDNTYRNFEFDLICGDADYQVITKENGINFEFDFSRVYWNPRLSTEHERIVNILQSNDVLYDVFAGVGPFSVPAAKKCCTVYANDLNPESYRWLQHNIKRNKCLNQATVFNKDGRDFILDNIKLDLSKRWSKLDKDLLNYNIHITMNLPALAVEFLNAFRGLFKNNETNIDFNANCINFPTVHVYTFAKGENTKSLAQALVEENLGLKLADNLEGIYFVRNVAPNKDMYRISFKLTKEILTTSYEQLKAHKRTAVDDIDAEPSKIKCC